MEDVVGQNVDNKENVENSVENSQANNLENKQPPTLKDQLRSLITIGVLIWFAWSILSNLGTTHKPVTLVNRVQIIDKANGYFWFALPQAKLSDIAVMSFDKAGLNGAAASLSGELLVTNNGGSDWQSSNKVPMDLGEQVTGLVVNAQGLWVSTGIDESNYSVIYHYANNEWHQITQDQAGIQALNGSFAVGSLGLIGELAAQTQQWEFRQLPEWGQINLYAISQADNQLVTVGEYGLIAESQDTGRSWSVKPPPFKQTSTLYSCLINSHSNTSYFGGDTGVLWQRRGEQYTIVDGLSRNMSVFSLYGDNNLTIAAGGDNSGNKPFIISSKDGLEWQPETLSSEYGRVVSVSQGQGGIFAATFDGYILLRQKL